MTVLDGAPLDVRHAEIVEFVHHAELGSTMDEVHRLGAIGARAGTVVLADRQHAGRGRSGKRWSSEPGDGLYFTLLEREVAPAALGVLSLRVGLALAALLAPWCDGWVGLKWPNDLLVRRAGTPTLAKLAGILVEARWRHSVPEWVAVGVGINLRQPAVAQSQSPAAALRPSISRASVLTAVVPRLRAAARADGVLSEPEMAAWRGRDVMVGQRVRSPAAGVVEGINASGALLLSGAVAPARAEHPHVLHRYRSGSLIIEEEASAC